MTLRLRKMSDLNRKRTLKALFTHTQGYPYPATLDADFDRTAGQLAGGGAVTGSSCAILPGSVMTKLDAENVTLSGATAGRRAFGLAAHFVGGDLDELGDSDSIGVWRGVGSTYLLRAPAFSDTGLAAAEAAEDGADGRLVFDTAANPTADFATAKVPVARLMKRHSSTAIEIELLV
jgi:hypothetical protein